MIKVRQISTTTFPIQFKLYLASDHISAATGLSPAVSISKNGAAFGAGAGAVTELSNGWYSWAGNATDRNTLGELAIRITAATADPYEDRYVIVPFDPFDAVRLGLTALPNAVAGANGGLPLGNASGHVTPADASITAAKIGADALTAAKFHADVTAEFQAGLATQASVDTIDDFLDTEIASIISTLGAAGAGLTAIPWNAAWDAEVQSEATDALNAYDPPTKAELDTAVDALPTAIENADALLDRNMATGTDSGSPTVRTVRQALRFLRNKWSISGTTLTVTKEDDTTASWTGTVTTNASGEPVTGNDPASS